MGGDAPENEEQQEQNAIEKIRISRCKMHQRVRSSKY
jgi:hypothetical protein